MGRVTGWVRCPQHVPGGLRAPVGASQMPVDDCYRNMQGAFYRDVGAYRALLETPGCLRWDTAFHIFGGLGTWGVLGGGGGGIREVLGNAAGVVVGGNQGYWAALGGWDTGENHW